MSFPRVDSVRLHRFREFVAVSFTANDSSGEPCKVPTFYVPADVAEFLAGNLSACVASIRGESFTANTFGTRDSKGEG